MEPLNDSGGGKKLFNIGIMEFEEISKHGISLDMLYILDLYGKGTDITIHIKGSKIEAWRLTLIRKGFLTPQNKLTDEGHSLLSGTNIIEGVAKSKIEFKKKIQDAKTEFDKWWDVFPATDGFVHKGITFEKSRGLRTDRNKCIERWNKIIAEGEFTAEAIIEATRVDVLLRKNSSVKDRKNNLKFLQNSATYLLQRSFEPFIGEKEKDIKINKPTGGAVDI